MPGMLGMARHRHAWGCPRVGIWTLMVLAGPFQMGISHGFMISSCCEVQESPVSHPWGPLRIPEVPLCRGFPNLASPGRQEATRRGRGVPLAGQGTRGVCGTALSAALASLCILTCAQP